MFFAKLSSSSSPVELSTALGTVSKKKKKLMEFSIKLAGWGPDAPVFH